MVRKSEMVLSSILGGVGTAGYSYPSPPPVGRYGAPRKHWFGVSTGSSQPYLASEAIYLTSSRINLVRLAALSSISRLTATPQLELEPLRLLPIKPFLGELHFARSCPPWAF